MDGSDRRKYKRYPFRKNILVNGTMSFQGIDISEGGLYVYTGRSFPENTEVSVELPLKDGSLTVRAKVQHNQPGIGMGLQFIRLTAEQNSIIKGLIETSVAESRKSAADERKKILLIEDDDKTRAINKSKLFSDGFSIIEAKDGIEAMKLLEEESPDLVILDLYMERMDGFKVLSILKIHPKWKDLPVIIFSARGTQDVIEKVISAGAEEFLSKMVTTPVKLAEMVKIVLKRTSQAD
jgi:CheY-like chemotaxis protein